MKPVMTEREQEIAGSNQQASSARWALASLALSMLLSSLGISIANIALPTLAQAFTASFQNAQWVVIAYLLAVTILIVSAGRLGDIMGHRRMLLIGILLFTVASVLCSVSPTLWMLVAARALQGLGAAILMALTIALVRETVPKKKTGRAMGLLGTMSAIGTALGPTLGGILIVGPGWRAIFLIMVPLGILNFLLAYRYLPTDKLRANIDRNSFDILGTLLLGLTLAAYALAVTVGDGQFDQFNLVLLLVAGLGAALFVLVQARVSSPLIRLATLRNLNLSASLAMNVLVATVMMATLVVSPFYLYYALGLNEAVVGIVMSIGPIISALSGVPAGHIVDRLGAPLIVIVGLITMAAGSFSLSGFPAMFGLVGYIAAIAILTPGYQLFQAANNTAVMMDIPSDQRGAISGLLSLSRNLGLFTGASVMGAVFAFTSITTDITMTTGLTISQSEATATGMKVTFAVAGGLIMIALGIAVGSHTLAKRMLTKNTFGKTPL